MMIIHLYPWQIKHATDVLSLFLETVGIWMGNNRIRLNPGKTEWLRVLEPSHSETKPSFV